MLNWVVTERRNSFELCWIEWLPSEEIVLSYVELSGYRAKKYVVLSYVELSGYRAKK
jgi:hypothetical protein